MKKQIIIVLSCLFCGVLQAQETGHYLHFNVGGGMHELSYNLQDGIQKGKAGFTVNAAYSYFFTPQWGFQTGVGIQNFNAQSTISFLSESPDIDTDGTPYIFRTNFQNSIEKQQALNLEIPLTGQYRHSLNRKFNLLATAGAKISIPLRTNFVTTGGQFITSGYYSQWDVELTDMPQHGFGTFSNTFNGNYSLKPAYTAIAEVGGLYKLAEQFDLYAGTYFNYGLNNVLTPGSKLIYQPNGIYNGVLTSNQTTRLNLVSMGLKIGIYWYPKKKNISVEKNQPIEPIPSIDIVKQKVTPDTLFVKKITDTLALDTTKKIDTLKIEVVKQTIDSVVQVQDTIAQKEASLEKSKYIAATIRVNFESESNQVGDSENDKVKALSDLLKANPAICIIIFGHTDNIGSYETNLIYGKMRALAMEQKFLLLGVPATQITTKSMSFDVPLVPNTSKKNRAKNRRTEITIFIRK